MNRFLKPLIAGGLAIAALGVSAASAHKPDPCRQDHDHRSHAADYYNYYPSDRYYRAGAYRPSGLSVSVSFSDHDYDRGRYDRYDGDGRRNGYRDSRIVNREVYDTRYRARIYLTEEVVRTRQGPRLICTVDARGPDARYVPNKHLRKVARNECSHRAEVRIVA